MDELFVWMQGVIHDGSRHRTSGTETIGRFGQDYYGALTVDA